MARICDLAARLSTLTLRKTIASGRAAALLILSVLTAPLPAAASAPGDLSRICDAAAAEAASRTGVPLTVLQAISLTETGRKRDGAFRPWPWTVNMEGKGLWFDTPDDARAYVYKEYKRGARSFDVGCFQINYKWHGQAFASIEAMFDPIENALYAAGYLSELFGETGDWSKAAGAYHSRTPEFADKYRARFDRIHSGLAGSSDTAAREHYAVADPYGVRPDIPEIPDIVLAANGGSADPATPPMPRVNTFPLLQAGATGTFGSLVPLDRAAGPGLFGAAPVTDLASSDLSAADTAPAGAD
jgi:Transglycosylase SLT domain